MTYPAYPYQPFKRPVPAPPVDPAGAFCWTFDRKWLPYVRGCLFALIHDRTWKTDADRAVGEASNLLASLAEAGECFPDDNDCVDFNTLSPIITYAPVDSVRNPGEIPPGYIAPPFYYIDEGNIAEVLGVAEIGDVISGYISLPVFTPALGEGLARFRISLFGSGVVEIHFIQIPHGGSALITYDDDPLTARTLELNKDLVSLPPETLAVEVVEVEISTPGQHHIDVTFLPRFNDELLFVAYGGGLRKIVLCGFDEMGDFVDVRQNATDKCKLEKSVDGVNWTQFADLQKCPPIIRRNGQQIQYGIPDEEGVTFFTFPEADETILGEAEAQWPPENVPAGESGACLAAENIVAMLQQEVTEWVNTLEAGGTALGLASVIAGILAFFIVPPLSVALLGFATVIVGVGASGLAAAFTTTVYNRFKCILFSRASSDGAFTVEEYADVLTDIQAESGTAWDIIEQWVDFRGAVGLTRMAAAAGITDGDCIECTDWCRYYDLSVSNDAASAHTYQGCTSAFSSGTGWQNTFGCAPGASADFCVVRIDFGQTVTVREMRLTGKVQNGSLTAFTFDPTGDGSSTTQVTDTPASGVSVTKTVTGLNFVGDHCFIRMNGDGFTDNVYTIEAVEFHGDTTAPLNGVPC